MSNLNGKRIVVAGCTGDVGAGIVDDLLKAGATVIVPVRSPAKDEHLASDLGHPAGLHLASGEFGPDGASQKILTAILADGPIDGAVASLGGWWLGKPMVEVPADDWEGLVRNNLTSHLLAAQALVPALAGRGPYVQILGAAAEYPVPTAGPISITAAAVAMMGRVLAAEGALVRQVMIAAFVSTRARRRPSYAPRLSSACHPA
jgi:NAD(P)-dependent dehydrogenase (short-subunit alcohol dehydrogenase family)